MQHEKVDRQDFEAILRARTLSPDDFELIFGPASNVPGKPAWTKPVIVRSKRTGVEKTYVGGGTLHDHWPKEFQQDLDNGVFG
jgi:hypothetical protein